MTTGFFTALPFGVQSSIPSNTNSDLAGFFRSSTNFTSLSLSAQANNAAVFGIGSIIDPYVVTPVSYTCASVSNFQQLFSDPYSCTATSNYQISRIFRSNGDDFFWICQEHLLRHQHRNLVKSPRSNLVKSPRLHQSSWLLAHLPMLHLRSQARYAVLLMLLSSGLTNISEPHLSRFLPLNLL